MESQHTYSKMRCQLALHSLECIPVYAFDRGERSIISNHQLNELMENASDVTIVTRELTLLLKLIEIPSKSMIVLTEPIAMSGKASDKHIVMLSRLAQNLDADESQVHIAAISALQQLAREILKYTVRTRDDRRQC